MSWDNLLSGLLGAALGLVGAVVIQWRQTRGAQAAAARAAYMEVAANSSALDFARVHGVYVPLHNSTWLAEQIRLAHALSPSDFVVVATYYMRVDLITGAGFPSGGAPTPSLVAAAKDAFERGEEAAALLEARGWWPWQRKAMRERLAALRALKP